MINWEEGFFSSEQYKNGEQDTITTEFKDALRNHTKKILIMPTAMAVNSNMGHHRSHSIVI